MMKCTKYKSNKNIFLFSVLIIALTVVPFISCNLESEDNKNPKDNEKSDTPSLEEIQKEQEERNLFFDTYIKGMYDYNEWTQLDYNSSGGIYWFIRTPTYNTKIWTLTEARDEYEQEILRDFTGSKKPEVLNAYSFICSKPNEYKLTGILIWDDVKTKSPIIYKLDISNRKVYLYQDNEIYVKSDVDFSGLNIESGDEEENPGTTVEVTGTWNYNPTENSGGKISFDDGSCSFVQKANNEETYTGTYSVSGSTLSINMSYEKTAGSSTTSTSYDEKYTVSIDSNNLTLTFISGKYTYNGTQYDSQNSACLLSTLWTGKTSGSVTLTKD